MTRSLIVGILVIVLAALGFAVAYKSVRIALRSDIERERDLSRYYKDRYWYFFNGANRRHLLELCRGLDGEVDVRFKEDCRE